MGSEKKSGTTTGSRMMTGTPLAALRLKAGLPRDGVGDSDDAALREAVEAPREAASMAWHRGRRRWHRGRQQRRGWENWAA
jgi:hypothetical protein